MSDYRLEMDWVQKETTKAGHGRLPMIREIESRAIHQRAGGKINDVASNIRERRV